MPRRAASIWFRAPRWSPTSVSPVTRNGRGLGRRRRARQRAARLSALVRRSESFQRTLGAGVEPRLAAQHDLLAVADLAVLVAGPRAPARPPAASLRSHQPVSSPSAFSSTLFLSRAIRALTCGCRWKRTTKGTKRAAVAAAPRASGDQPVLAAQLVGLDVEVEPALVAQAEAARPAVVRQLQPDRARRRRGGATSTHARRRRAAAGPAPGPRTRSAARRRRPSPTAGGRGRVHQPQRLRPVRAAATSRSRRSAGLPPASTSMRQRLGAGRHAPGARRRARRRRPSPAATRPSSRW